MARFEPVAANGRGVEGADLRSLTGDLLGLAAAQAFGGAEADVSTLAAQLTAEAPFSSGEVVVRTGAEWRGWPQTDS